MNERNLASSPNQITIEPPKQTGMSRIRYLRKITSWKPAQYEAILHAYAKTPQISGETLVNAKEQTGDEAETELVDIPLPQGWTQSTGPIQRGDEYLLVRPEIGEAIQVSPIRNPQALPTASTYASNPAENHYLRKPATDYDKTT